MFVAAGLLESRHRLSDFRLPYLFRITGYEDAFPSFGERELSSFIRNASCIRGAGAAFERRPLARMKDRRVVLMVTRRA